MTRERDTHPRFRATGRLSRTQAVEQSIKLATDEVELAIAARDIKSARVHASIARRFLADALEKLAKVRE